MKSSKRACIALTLSEYSNCIEVLPLDLENSEV
jgi:hypothetical protein